MAAFEIGYLRAAAQDEAYSSFLTAFLRERECDPSITKAFIARRSGKSPEQVSRYLGSPGNWTIDTYAVLCAAIGYKPVFGVEKIRDIRQGNVCHSLVSESGVNTLQVGSPGENPSDVHDSAEITRVISLHPPYDASGQPVNLLYPLTSAADQMSKNYCYGQRNEKMTEAHLYLSPYKNSGLPNNEISLCGSQRSRPTELNHI